MISLVVETFIKAFLLMILVYIVARDEADYDFRKMAMVTAGVTLGCVIIEGVLISRIGLFVLLPMAALIVFMVMQFCWVRFWRSLLIAVPFLILNMMISTATSTFNLGADKAMSRGMQGPVTEKDMREAFQFLNESVGDGRMPDPFQQKEKIKTPETTEQILMKFILAFFSTNKMPAKAFPNLKTSGPIIGHAEGGRAAPRAGIPAGKSVATEPFDSAQGLEPVERRAGRLDVQAESAEWQEAQNKINVNGTLVEKDGVRVAIVNNRVVREGEVIEVVHRKMVYRWKATAIGERSVSWERLDGVSAVRVSP